jgi:YbgC/YbaW family acyl-CoA thioester hydrolase
MVEHVERVRVALSDTDAMGVVHYKNVFRFFELAETEFMRSIGFPYSNGWTAGFPRVQASVAFRKGLRYDDLIDVRVRPSKVGTSSVVFEFTILREGEVCVEGSVTCVAVGEGRSSQPLPEAVRAALLGETGTG